jgi:hypothetical protein
MNEVQEAAPEVTVKCPGATLTLLPPNWSVQRSYPLYLERQIISRLGVHQAFYPVDLLKLQLAELNNQMGIEKKWAWRKPAWRDSLDDQDNRRYLLFLTLTQERRPGAGAINPNVTEEWLASVWDQPYSDDGDLWYQQSVAALREQGSTYVITCGDKLWQVMMEFLNRPNSPTPPAAGAVNTTSPKSAPSS